MSSVTFSNKQWLVQALDANKNGVMEELKVDDRVKAKVDSDNNGQVSAAELTSALKADAVEINKGVITESRGMNIYVEGLETLKNVNSTAKNSIAYAFTPVEFYDDTFDEQVRKLEVSIREYRDAGDRMKNALRSIKSMTDGKQDATSRALNIQASTALSSTNWNDWGTFALDIVGVVDGNTVSELQQKRANLQAKYEVTKSTLQAIVKQTNDLPDVQATIKATDNSIAKAFSNVVAIQNSSQTPQQVSDKLVAKAEATAAEATGRMGPFAGIGAGIGAVGGGLIGFFAGGKSVKSAAIGAGVGTAAAAGIGAIIGHSIDQKFLGEAEALKKLAGDVTSYNPEADKQTLLNATVNTYNGVLDARNKHDLDNARVVDNDLRKIQGTVAPVEQRSARILSAYNQ